MSKVAVVTDSTATIPAELLAQHNISVAPQVVIFGEESLKDGVDIQPSEFYERLANSSVLPTTSQAAVPDFEEIFNRLTNQGYEILCIVVSNKLSNTYNSAIQARELVPDARVEIIDSLSVAMAMGFQVLAAAKLADSGASLAECKAFAEANISSTGVFVAPETLEYLHRGGRIGGATRFLGTALNIKPLIELRDGRLEPVERVRTRKKMLARLVELTEQAVGDRRPVRVSTLHANSLEDAQVLLEMAKERLNPVEAVLSEVSPVIGTHIGPGTVALAFMAGVE